MTQTLLVYIGNRTTLSTIRDLTGTRDVLKVLKLHSPFLSTNQNTVTISFISPLFVFTSETSQTLRSNVGNLRKTSVEPRTPSKFFGSSSEIFESLWINFVNLRNTLDHHQKSSEVFGSTLEIFGCLVVNWGCLRLFRKTMCLRVWRVQFGINWYSIQSNLGFIVLLV